MATFVIPPNDSETSDSSSEDSEPLAKIAKRYRKERDNSENEDEIPQLELRRRINMRTNIAHETDTDSGKSETEDSESMTHDAENFRSAVDETEDAMDIDSVTHEVRDERLSLNQKKKMKKLLQCIAGIF